MNRRLLAQMAILMSLTVCVIGTFAIAEEPLATAAPAVTILDISATPMILFPGETREVTLPFTIPAGSSFTPRRIERSCSCLHVDAPAEEIIPAGETREVRAFISAGDLKGIIGSEFSIIGEDGGGKAAQVRFKLSAEVRDALVWPRGALMDLGEREKSALPAMTTIVVRRGPHPQPFDRLSIAIEGGDGLLTATVRTIDNDQWGIDFKIGETPITGTTTARLVATFTNHGKAIDYHAERLARWTTIGPWLTKPGGFLFGIVPINGSCRKVALLTHRDGAPGRAQITSITSSDIPRATCSVDEDGEFQHLVATFTGASPLGAASGHFDVTFTDGGVLRVPYFAGIGPAAGQGDALSTPAATEAPAASPAKF